MSNTTDKTIGKVETFFRETPWKKILTFSFFVVLAAIFWVIQVYRQKFETTLHIPVKYISIPDSIIFDNDLPATITVRIKDDGASLFKYHFLKRNDSLIVDVRALIKNSDNNKSIQGTAFNQMIRSKLYVTSELISYTPTYIPYSYALLAQRRLPVIYDGYINLPAGYIIDGDLQVLPDTVTLYGSKAALDTLRYVHTVSDTITGIRSDTTMLIGLRTIKGVRYSPSKVRLSAPVDQFTSKSVEVPITCINLPSNLKIKFFPSTVKVEFLVGLKRYKDINPENFSIVIDYNDVLANVEEPTLQIRIIDSPDYIRSMAPSPSEVEFVIEQE